MYGRGQTYSPENFGKAYSNRDVSLREGLVHSLNVVTVRIAEKVGYPKIARFAEKLGLREEGVARRYLQIAGVWEDHVRYGITAEEADAGRARGDALLAPSITRTRMTTPR